jgi:hypothetical protein
VENNISKAIVLGHFRISDLVAQMSLCYDLLDGLLVTTKCQVKDKQTSRGGLQHLIIPDVLEIKVSDRSTLNYQVDVCVDLAEIPISGASSSAEDHQVLRASPAPSIDPETSGFTSSAREAQIPSI